jgi:hypothetical protein
MPAVPLFLDGYPVIAYTRIDGRQRPTGATRHYEGGRLLGPAAGLAICRHAEGSFYLFGCDADWNTVTDTWHDSLDDALHQAEYEYAGVGGTWEWPAGRPG